MKMLPDQRNLFMQKLRGKKKAQKQSKGIFQDIFYKALEKKTKSNINLKHLLQDVLTH